MPKRIMPHATQSQVASYNPASSQREIVLEVILTLTFRAALHKLLDKRKHWADYSPSGGLPEKECVFETVAPPYTRRHLSRSSSRWALPLKALARQWLHLQTWWPGRRLKSWSAEQSRSRKEGLCLPGRHIPSQQKYSISRCRLMYRIHESFGIGARVT